MSTLHPIADALGSAAVAFLVLTVSAVGLAWAFWNHVT